MARADKLDLLAYERTLAERRQSLLDDARKKIPGAMSLLAQVLLLLDE